MNSKIKIKRSAPIDVMEHYFEEHGVACSPSGMAFELHLAFPDSGPYKSHCEEFLKMKLRDLKLSKTFKDVPLKEIRPGEQDPIWQSIRDCLTIRLCIALKGLRYEY